MADYGFVSPGAAFGGGFEDYLTRQQAQQHQLMLEDLANKREQRLAQAELDSQAEHQDALAQKKVKDLSDQHDKEVKDFQAHVKDTYVKGDRPAPEDVETAKRLNLGGVFRQAAPAMSADTSTMAPAALMEAPPPEATAAGTGANIADTEGAVEPGAMTPGPATFAGTPQERATADLQQRREAFIAKLPPDLKQEAQLAFEAESLGMKTPTGLLSKTGATGTDGEAVLRQNPRTGSVERLTPQGWTPHQGDVPKGAHWMTEPAPKDTTVHDMARESQLQRTREHAFERIDKEIGKGELSKITAADDITTALAQNSEVADATLAPLVLKSTVTAGGNSGFRMTKPEIDRVLTKSVGDDLMLKLNSWTGNGPLQLTAEQKVAIRKLGRAIRTKAAKSYADILDSEERINGAKSDAEVNGEVTKLKRQYAAAPADESSDQNVKPPVAGRIVYGPNGMPLPVGGQ